jgi:hypothetical protein
MDTQPLHHRVRAKHPRVKADSVNALPRVAFGAVLERSGRAALVSIHQAIRSFPFQPRLVSKGTCLRAARTAASNSVPFMFCGRNAS